MTSTLRIHLLGDFRLSYDNAPVAGVPVAGAPEAGVPITGIDSPRLQSLLAYLVLHRDAPQSRSHLAFAFWLDSTEAQARTNLRKQVYYLRRALPDAERFLYADSKVLQWLPNGPFTLDVADFERAIDRAEQAEQDGDRAARRSALEQAVDLYRGDLLPSCYDDWVFPERERLRGRFTRTLEQLIRLLEGQREYQPAIQYCQRLLQHDPLLEESYRRLMRLQALNGDRARALRTYHTCVTVLQRELDVEPSAATRRAYERLLNREAPSALVPLTESFAPVSPLVGRDGAWGQIQAAWRAAEGGQPHLLLLRGEAGIGKTRLAEELLEWADRQGIATAGARCYASEGGLAYAAVASWLRTEALGGSFPALDEMWLSEVARLLPELLVKRPEIPHPAPLTEPWQRQRLFEALVLAFSGRQPLVLLLDDAQWCDGETLEWLPYLLGIHVGARSRGERPLQLLVVATLRTEEMPADGRLASLLRDLHRTGQASEIELGPLDEAASATLAAHVAGRALGSELETELYRETEGNPLFVIETVRAGLLDRQPGPGGNGMDMPPRSWPLPPAVHDAIAARLAQLSPEARELVNVAATVGREFTFDVVLQASTGHSSAGGGNGLPEYAADEEAWVCALDELWQRRIVREQGAEAYDFGHDKIREVAMAELSPVRRQFLHRRVAAAMETVYDGSDAVSGQIARHYEQAGLLKEAIPHYRRAAAVARRLYANEEAVGYYQHLLHGDLAQKMPVLDTCSVMLDLGRVWRLTGEWAKAEATYRQALVLAESVDDLSLQARCQQALADILRLQGAYGEALPWLERAGDDFLAAGDPQGVIRVLWTMGEVYWYQGDHGLALAALERQLHMAEEIGAQRGMCDALGTMGIVLWSQGGFERARACCERSIEIARQIGHQWAVGRATITLGNICSSQGDYLKGLDWYRQALELADRIGDRQCVEWAITNIGNHYARQGDFDRAQACEELGLRNALEIGDRWSASIALANLGETLAERGRVREAERLYLKAIALGRALRINYLHSYLWSLAQLYSRQGRYDEAQSLNDEALDLAEQAGEGRMGGEDILFKARLLSVRLRVEQGQIDEPTALAELERMHDPAFDWEQRAMLCYEFWRLDPTQESRRTRAAAGYRGLNRKAPRYEYRRRYQDLTGRALPPPPPLPDLPDIVQSGRVDIDALLAEVDQILGEPATRQA